MSFNATNYEIIPCVVKSDQEQTITILPRGDHARFDDSLNYIVKFTPMECCNVSHSIVELGTANYDEITVMPINGVISFTYCFQDEQEWIITINPNNNQNYINKFHVYSLSPDLFEKNPYKGDLHVHSSCSDGKEEPAIVAANYRKAGFDFMAVTDHHKWYPSEEAINKYKDVPIDLKLFHGEEVHIPGGYIHIVNFGGSYSINELYTNNKEKYDKEIKQYSEKITVPIGVNALEYSYRKWITDNIRKSEGLSILAHPHWIYKDEYNMQSKMVDYVFETNAFDAFEVLGGQSVLENNLQVAFYNEQRAKGRNIPIVGSSDSHGTQPPVHFNNMKTLVFSKNLELESICDAIKNMYSVAVESMPGESYRIYGPYRMVKYALFLMNYYFPKHDVLCVEEGLLMSEYICGNKDVKEALSNLSGRTETFAKCFLGK